MATFLHDLRTAVLGTAHSLLNKEIDMNSIPFLEQTIRDFEAAQVKLNAEAATEDGHIRGLKREIGDLEHQIANEEKIVSAALTTAPDKARAHAAQIVVWKRELTDKQTALTEQQAASDKLDTAITAFNTKHNQMVARLRTLRSLDRESKAKERMSKAADSITQVMEAGADVNVDNLEQRMRERNDVAAAKFDRSLAAVHVEEDPEMSSAVDDVLNSLKPQEAVVAK